MTSGTLVPRENDFIEVAVTPSGSTKVYCSKCKQPTYSGQQACCEWSTQMLDKYFSGEPANVATDPLYLTDGN